MTEDLTLKVNNTTLSGWTSIRATRGVERMPSDFDISLTERFPDDASIVVAQPGDKCQVLLGSDVVITGYINRFDATIDKANHTIRIIGRSMSQDLVDCSALWPTGQISGTNALDVAQRLAKPYGISVSSTAGAGPKIPQFNLIIGETTFNVIERVCRYSGLLAYDKPDGSVVLAQTGTARAASGFAQGVNAELASFMWSDDETYSRYDVFGLSMMTFSDAGVINQPIASVSDPNVKRLRLKYSVAESGAAGYALCEKRGKWEAARRHGRSWRLTLRTDGWRDSAGKLWEPNTIAQVSFPSLHLQAKELCIGEVTYRRDDRGTTAEIGFMLPGAFLPEPINLLPFHRDVVPPGGTRG